MISKSQKPSKLAVHLFLKGTRQAKSPGGGSTMPKIMTRLFLTVTMCILNSPWGLAQSDSADDLTVYARMDRLEIKDQGRGPRHHIPLNIEGSSGLKLAFLARATGGISSVPLNMFDATARDNTTPQAYMNVDTDWRPIVYRIDQFRYNSSMKKLVTPQATFSGIQFHGKVTKKNKGVLYLQNLVVYRGEDTTPPQAPIDLSSKQTPQGIHLSWPPAIDNIGTALYVISRAKEKEGFIKVAESSLPEYVDHPSDVGGYRYRVLAVDFENNMSPWSKTTSITVENSYPPAALTPYEQDRLRYSENIRRIFQSGKNTVRKGWILQFGDSLTGAHLYRTAAESALGRYSIEARGRAGWKTSRGREIIDSDLKQVNPEFCFILYGTNNRKDASGISRAMQDLLKMAQACAAHGTVPIIATIPPSFKKHSRGSEESFNAALIETCRPHNIPIAYLYEEIQAQPNPRSFFVRDGVHWHKKAFPLTGKVWKQAMEQVMFALLDRPD